MPLPIFLPCAAGVEALLDAEVRALLPEARMPRSAAASPSPASRAR